MSASRLVSFHERLEQATSHYKILTRALLRLTRTPRLASFVARRIDRCPELYATLLGINCGVRRFGDVRLRDLPRFLVA